MFLSLINSKPFLKSTTNGATPPFCLFRCRWRLCLRRSLCNIYVNPVGV